MAETTTLDPPAETAETQTELPDETQATPLEGGGTDVQGEAQTDPTPEVETPEQHTAKLEADRLEAERAAIREEERARLETERNSEQARLREAQRKARLKEAFPNARTKIESLLADFENPPTQDFIQALESLNLVAEEVANDRIAEDYRAAFDAGLGEGAEAFWKEAEALEEDGSIPVAALLELYAEKKALSSKPLRTMTLEQAKTASPVVAREIAKALQDEYQRGREHPLPAGEPSGDGNGSTVIRDASWLTSLSIEEYERVPEADRRSIWAMAEQRGRI